jgi:hypothetical protein
LAAVAAIADSDPNLHDLVRVVEADDDRGEEQTARTRLRKTT